VLGVFGGGGAGSQIGSLSEKSLYTYPHLK